MAIHRAAQAFDGVAAEYERGRPSYPEPAIAWLADRLGLAPGRSVVDLAAGTGKLTRQLVPFGPSIVAIEPVAGMRAELQRRVPGVDVVDGTAERMPMPDHAVDAVTVGQAFHWFDGPTALAEVYRVLRPGGRLGVVWNVRDLADPLQAALSRVMNRYRGTTPSYGSGAWRAAFDASDLFTPLEVQTFPMVQELDEDAAVDRVVSTSVIAALPADERAAVEQEVRAIIEDVPRPVPLPYVTEVYVCSARS